MRKSKSNIRETGQTSARLLVYGLINTRTSFQGFPEALGRHFEDMKIDCSESQHKCDHDLMFRGEKKTSKDQDYLVIATEKISLAFFHLLHIFPSF